MKINIATTNQQGIRSFVWTSDVIQVILGSLYIALLAQIKIPLYPVSVTLQTFAIFSLALFLGSKKSCFSLLLYLVEGTVGLPVFPGLLSDPLWFMGLKAGYYFSFPVAAYMSGKFAEHSLYSQSAIKLTLGLCLANAIIYLTGVTWLSFFIGWKAALVGGLFPFVVFDMVKLLAAVSIKMAVKHLSYKQTN